MSLSSETLVLVEPENLSSSYQLTGSKDKLCAVLNLSRQALAAPSHQQALMTINQALEMLGSVEVLGTREGLVSNTSLETSKSDDFDNFFALRHVQVKEPAECLVMSVLTAYRALLELNACISLEAATVEAQKIGFKSCVSLLIRAFNLSLEECYD